MRILTVLFCTLCVPYLCTVLWGNAGSVPEERDSTDAVPVFAQTVSAETASVRCLSRDRGWYEERIDMEDYLAERLAEYAAENMQTEALKALAVVLRTELQEGQVVPSGGGHGSVAGDRYRCAVAETRGIILSYEGAPANALWTYVSNGVTRDASENSLVSAPYLKKKTCRKDILSEEYSSQVVYGKKQFEDILCGISVSFAQGDGLKRDAFGWPVLLQIRDSSGYTKKLIAGTDVIEGGAFADAFLLRSPSFDMEFGDDKVIFHVAGYGHGFGMSLYAADRMAEEGKDFMEILSFFYPGTELKKQ